MLPPPPPPPLLRELAGARRSPTASEAEASSSSALAASASRLSAMRLSMSCLLVVAAGSEVQGEAVGVRYKNKGETAVYTLTKTQITYFSSTVRARGKTAG